MKQVIFGAVTALAIFVGVTQANAAEIHDAAIRGDLAGVQRQLDSGVETDLTTQLRHTALMYAATHGHTEIVNTLLAHRADVNHATNSGFTALTQAATHGHTEIVSTLLAHDADVNHATTSGFTALIQAADRGYTEIVEQLLQVPRIDVLAKNNWGEAALDLACKDEIKQLIQQRINEIRGSKTKSAANRAS